jgi:hypothetical protein
VKTPHTPLFDDFFFSAWGIQENMVCVDNDVNHTNELDG